MTLKGRDLVLAAGIALLSFSAVASPDLKCKFTSVSSVDHGTLQMGTTYKVQRPQVIRGLKSDPPPSGDNFSERASSSISWSRVKSYTGATETTFVGDMGDTLTLHHKPIDRFKPL